MTNANSQYYPGEDLGLPKSGFGSIAGLPLRVGAILIDWTASSLLAMAFFGYEPFPDKPGLSITMFAPMVIFGVLNIIFIPTLGGTPGHRIVGMRVFRADGAWTGIWRPIVRTIGILLVIPAVVWDQDNRGLHDKIAGTILLRSPGIFSSSR